MALNFRKRVGLGPLALNFSKGGIGVSAGVRGLRAGLTSHGRVYTSAGVPGTGVRYVRYYKHHHAAEPSPFAAAFAVGVLLPFIALFLFALAAVLR